MKTASVEFYPLSGRRPLARLYGWRVRAANGKVIASGEPNGFSSISGAQRAFERARAIVSNVTREEFVLDFADAPE